MQTDVQVAGNPVLAVVLGEIASKLTYPLATIRKTIKQGNKGQTQVTKDFLQHGSHSTTVRRDSNSRRRKCEAIYLSRLDSLSSTQLKAGTCNR